MPLTGARCVPLVSDKYGSVCEQHCFVREQHSSVCEQNCSVREQYSSVCEQNYFVREQFAHGIGPFANRCYPFGFDSTPFVLVGGGEGEDCEARS